MSEDHTCLIQKGWLSNTVTQPPWVIRLDGKGIQKVNGLGTEKCGFDSHITL